jgi:hypothetical protein
MQERANCRIGSTRVKNARPVAPGVHVTPILACVWKESGKHSLLFHLVRGLTQPAADLALPGRAAVDADFPHRVTADSRANLFFWQYETPAQAPMALPRSAAMLARHPVFRPCSPPSRNAVPPYRCRDGTTISPSPMGRREAPDWLDISVQKAQAGRSCAVFGFTPNDLRSAVAYYPAVTATPPRVARDCQCR